jgi:hypothetical protein
MNQRLCHDCALMMTQHCIELLINVLDEVKQQQAREGIYAICLAGIEAYDLQSDRMQQRLRPLDN